VLSTGLVVTTPTAPALEVPGESDINPVVFQPFLGFISNPSRDWFFQGFSSIAVPTDARDVTLLFNSLGAGYWLYRNEGPASGDGSRAGWVWTGLVSSCDPGVREPAGPPAFVGPPGPP
jgi:hypothetical protein